MGNYTEVEPTWDEILAILYKTKDKYETKKDKNESMIHILKHNNEVFDIHIKRIECQIGFIKSKQKEEKE